MNLCSVDELADHIKVHSCVMIIFGAELLQALHDVLVGHSEDALNLVDSECASRRIVRAILKISNVNMLVTVSLLGAQCEEASAVETMCARVKVVAKELEELSQILRERTELIDAESFQKGRRHEHYRVRVESARVRLV